MNIQSNKHITIVGSGLAGSFLALMFADRGYDVDIYEQLPKSEICDTNSKRSYNITLYKYGIEMLKKAKIWDTLQNDITPLRYFSTQLGKNTKPVVTKVNYNKNEYFTFSRSGLLNALLNRADKHPRIKTNYDTKLLSIDRYQKTMVVQDNKTNKISIVKCTIIFGADGVNSVVRSWLQQAKQSSHTQDYANWSYKQFAISKEWATKLELDNNTSYTWSRNNGCIASFPNADGSIAAILILPQDKNGHKSLKSEDDVRALFAKEFSNLLPMVKDITPQLLANPEGKFVTIHTDPWYYNDFIALVGDAAHGFYPFFGQGTSAAFGDCMKILDLVDTYGPDWGKILPLYQEQRKKHMDTLGEISRVGFQLYLRTNRADFSAIYNHVESTLHTKFPKLIKPPLYYSIITDPDNTDNHVQAHTKQRNVARYFGLSAVVILLTGGVFLVESANKIVRKFIIL